MDVFNTLNALNVNEHTEKKVTDGGKTMLTYLSWPWAWAEVKKRFPNARYEIKRGKNGLPYSCDPCTGYMVFTSVTIDDVTHDMWLPVMDGNNNAMKQSAYSYTVKNPNYKYAKMGDDGKYYDKYGNEQPPYFEKTVKAATMFDVNKAIMRCLTKNLAMFGLGLYIYAGEDLPESDDTTEITTTKNWDPRAAISSWSFAHGITAENFNSLKNALVEAGLLEKVKYDDMSPKYVDRLCHMIEQNYPDQLRKPA